MSNTEEIKFNEMDERIERFLRGEMSAEEEARFREELKSDTELRDHARAVTALLKGLQEKGKQHDQEIINEVTAQKPRNNIRRLVMWTLSAAAVVALYFGYSYHAENLRYERVNEMLTPYYVRYDIDELSRGETDSATVAHLYTLFNRIPKEKDMTNIITELEPIYASINDDFTYYPYANDIAWNLALAYVKDGKTNQAKDILHELIQTNGNNVIAERAKEILIEIDANR